MILSDIAEIFDCPHSTAPDEGEGYPLIRTPNVGKGRLLLDGVHRVCREAYLVRTKRAIPRENDIIFAREAPAGNAAVIVKGQNVCLGQRTVLIRPNNRIVNSHYLVYYLLLPKQQIKLIGYAHGSTVGHVNIPDLAKLPVDLPDYETQNRIANIIERYDNLIEVNNKRIKVLEQMAENLYKEWFVRFRFPGYENAEFENDTPRGWTLSTEAENKRPKSWHYGQFSELGSFVRGKNITSAEMIDGDVPVVSAGIEPSGCHVESNVKGKSLTISASGANAGYLKYNLDDIWAADCSYYQSEDKFWFAYHSLRFLQLVISNLQCGAAQPHVHPKQINRLSIIIPPVSIIHDYCFRVSSMYDEIKKLMDSNRNLIKQRDLLLPRLMSGKLEV